MTKFKVFIYTEYEPNERSTIPFYADRSFSLSVEFRPLVGDIYVPEDSSLLSDSQVKGFRVDSVIY